MERTFGPTATISAQAKRFPICAVAGINIPPVDLLSPSSSSNCTRIRSLSIFIGRPSSSAGPGILTTLELLTEFTVSESQLSTSHDKTSSQQFFFHIRYCQFSKMKYRSSQKCVCTTKQGSLNHMAGVSCTAACN